MENLSTIYFSAMFSFFRIETQKIGPIKIFGKIKSFKLCYQINTTRISKLKLKAQEAQT